MEIINDVNSVIKIITRRIRSLVRKNKYPYELQFPITYKCNFDCVMCGMRNLIDKDHCSVVEIEKILNNRLYKNIRSVGINGGEPFIRQDLYECIEVIINSLPRLSSIFIISNGFFTERIAEVLPKIKALTQAKNIELTVSFSVDGINEMQDCMRGKKDAFKRLTSTLDIIQKDIERYCDHLNTICTITKCNVYNLHEVELWSEMRNIEVSYNVATINARINNEKKFEDFSVFTEKKAQMMAAEFFYKKYTETKNEKYYGLFLFCCEQKRYSECSYQKNDGVTITPDGMICYCATHSKELSSVVDEDSYDIFYANKNYQRNIVSNYCDKCSHYIYRLNLRGMFRLISEKNKRRTLNLYRKGKQKKWNCV